MALAREKRVNPTIDRNSEPIAHALYFLFDIEKPDLQCLEIASGWGQHCGYLARRFTNITFQPSESDRVNFPSISAYAAECPKKNMRQPLFIDVSLRLEAWSTPLPRESLDYIINFNMIHGEHWCHTVGLFKNAFKLLKPHGLLITYAPFGEKGHIEPASNVRFDDSLRGRNPDWGIRDIADIHRLAKDTGFALKKEVNMPESTKLLAWIKIS